MRYYRDYSYWLVSTTLFQVPRSDVLANIVLCPPLMIAVIVSLHWCKMYVVGNQLCALSLRAISIVSEEGTRSHFLLQ
jgi:hypothetical protein